MSRFTLLLGAVGLFAGCSEYDIKQDPDYQGDLHDDAAPDIEVTPSSVVFSSLEVVEGADEVQILSIKNVGLADLHIDDFELDVGVPAYTLGAISSVVIPPEGNAEISVTFKPETSAVVEDAVLIYSDDPDEPVVEVPLTGEGIAPAIEVSPSGYDFGTVYIGCEHSQTLTITNVGNAPLLVDSFDFTAATEELSFNDNIEGIGIELPWELAPSEFVEVYVNYYPLDLVNDQAWLYISSNDPYTPVAVAFQEGDGALYGENTDVYEQPIQAATDIIFAVDKSCSMDDDIRNVESNFGVFVDTLSGLDADYHVAAVVNDDGCVLGDPWIDNSFSAAEAEDAITTMIALGASYGNNTERAFSLLEACLDEIGSGGCNEGLVREDAKLNLIGVSDEVEQSTKSWSYYVSAFQELKEDPDDVVFHAIGGDVPGGCGTNEPYTGFYEATVATGGVFLSICATDWGAHLEALAEGSAAILDTFPLTQTPVPETIVVKVDGIKAGTGWEYIEASNSVLFWGEYVPEGGSTVEISYSLIGDCSA